MKTYEEMIQRLVDNAEDRLRSCMWPAMLTVSETYLVPYESVRNDVAAEKEIRLKALREERKKENQASNEHRRLANLTKRQEVEQ
jgi:hypothetical protein